jgi:hypothetical protein
MFLKRVLSAERANDSFNLDILGDVPFLRHFPCFHFTVFAGSMSGARFKLDKANVTGWFFCLYWLNFFDLEMDDGSSLNSLKQLMMFRRNIDNTWDLNFTINRAYSSYWSCLHSQHRVSSWDLLAGCCCRTRSWNKLDHLTVSESLSWKNAFSDSFGQILLREIFLQLFCQHLRFLHEVKHLNDLFHIKFHQWIYFSCLVTFVFVMGVLQSWHCICYMVGFLKRILLCFFYVRW